MTHDHVASHDVVAAAREVIHQSDGYVVSFHQPLGELNDKLGERFSVSAETYRVLDLIAELWSDPHIGQVPGTGLTEFVSHDAGRKPLGQRVAHPNSTP